MTCDRYDPISNAIGACEDLDRLLDKADDLANEIYRKLDARSDAYANTLPTGFDVSLVQRDLALMRAFLAGLLSRIEDGSARDNPYLTPHPFEAGKTYVREYDKARHDAWREGFKTLEEVENDAAERQSDDTDRERCGGAF